MRYVLLAVDGLRTVTDPGGRGPRRCPAAPRLVEAVSANFLSLALGRGRERRKVLQTAPQLVPVVGSGHPHGVLARLGLQRDPAGIDANHGLDVGSSAVTPTRARLDLPPICWGSAVSRSRLPCTS